MWGQVIIMRYNSPFKSFYEYDPTTDAWTQEENYGRTMEVTRIQSGIGFSIGNIGYFGTGLWL